MSNFSSLKGEFVPFLLKKQMEQSIIRVEGNGDVENIKSGERTNNVSGLTPDIQDTQSDFAQDVMVNKSILNVCML